MSGDADPPSGNFTTSNHFHSLWIHERIVYTKFDGRLLMVQIGMFVAMLLHTVLIHLSGGEILFNGIFFCSLPRT